MESEGLAWFTFISVAVCFGFVLGRTSIHQYNHRIEPTEIKINQQTGDTTFVYIMEW